MGPKRPGLDEGDRGGPPTRVGQSIQAYLDQAGLSKRMRGWPALNAWREVLGEELSKRVRPVAFRAGELVVEVESTTLLSQLKGFTGETFRQRANAQLGDETILRVNYKLRR